jgi:hypothetical protein
MKATNGRAAVTRSVPGRFDSSGELNFALALYLQFEWTRRAKESLAASTLAICRNAQLRNKE